MKNTEQKCNRADCGGTLRIISRQKTADGTGETTKYMCRKCAFIFEVTRKGKGEQK